MNMSLREIFVWLTSLDFPSLYAIWTWLITVPWWLAIGTVVFTVFAVRIIWELGGQFFRWLSEWMYDAGGWLREIVKAVKRYTSMTVAFSKAVKKALIP